MVGPGRAAPGCGALRMVAGARPCRSGFRACADLALLGEIAIRGDRSREIGKSYGRVSEGLGQEHRTNSAASTKMAAVFGAIFCDSLREGWSLLP